MQSSGPAHRLFLSIDLPEDLRSLVGGLTQQDRSLWPAGYQWRLSRPEQLHFTLKFLGSTAPELMGPIEAALGPVASRTAPFPVALHPRLSQFRGAQGSRIVWMNVNDQPAFAELARHLDDALSPLGFAPEARTYQPHLTLARGRPEHRERGELTLNRLEEKLASHRDKLAQAWIARDFILYESFTKREGAHYREIRRFPFTADPCS